MPEGIIQGAKPDPAYWQALGQFIEVYASVESMMFYLLTLYSKVPADIAKALFSGTRLDASIKLIRRIMAVNDPGEVRREELNVIFAQLTVINDARNDVIHYGSNETIDYGRISSNYTRAHLPENVTVRPMSAVVLEAMRHDLERIHSHLFVQCVLPDNKGAKPSLTTLLAASWQYKPPQDHEIKMNKPARRVEHRSQAPHGQR